MAIVRYRDKPEIVGDTSTFNTSSLTEVIVYFPDGAATSEEALELEVLLETGWMHMPEAFRTRKLIPDNYNRSFREPLNAEEMEKGYYG